VNSVDNFTQEKAKTIAKIIKRFSSFLKDFSYTGFHEKSGMNHWHFSHKFPQYTFKIIFAEKGGKWMVKIFVYWKKATKDMTAGAGKDFDYKIGPNDSFSDLIVDIKRKIENNPIMGHKLYEDDFEFNMDLEAIPLITKLKQHKDKLFSIKNPFFNDLKGIYNKIKHIPEDKLLDYCRIHNNSEADKQDFLLDLQKVDKLDYYSEMKKLGHIQ
jgi:hypothetical protein